MKGENRMTLAEKIDVLRKAAKELDLPCIVYAFEDIEPDGMCSGFDYRADFGDALLAIKRIVKRFGVNTEALTCILGEKGELNAS